VSITWTIDFVCPTCLSVGIVINIIGIRENRRNRPVGEPRAKTTTTSLFASPIRLIVSHVVFYTNSEHLKRYMQSDLLCGYCSQLCTQFRRRSACADTHGEDGGYSYTYIYTAARAFLRLKIRGQYLHIIYNIYTPYMYRARHCDDPFKSSYIPFCAETAPDDDDDDDRRVSCRYARDKRAARAAFICVAKRSMSSADGA